MSGGHLIGGAAFACYLLAVLLDFARRSEGTKDRVDLRSVAGRCTSILGAMATKAGVSAGVVGRIMRGPQTCEIPATLGALRLSPL